MFVFVKSKETKKINNIRVNITFEIIVVMKYSRVCVLFLK